MEGVNNNGCHWWNPCSWFNGCCADDPTGTEREPINKGRDGHGQRQYVRSHSPVRVPTSPSDKGTPTRYGQADIIEEGKGTPPE